MIMNTTLTILLLIALVIAIICDIIRIFQYIKAFEASKKKVKETICKAVSSSYKDWYWGGKGINCNYGAYFKDNFDKYL